MDYLAWTAVTLLFIGCATAICIPTWSHHVRRDTRDAARLAEERAETLRQHERAERQAVQALVASERRHRALAEAGAVAVWHADRTGRLMAVEGWERLTGDPAAAVIGDHRRWLEPVVAESRDAVAAAWAKAVATGCTFEAEFQLETASGDPRWLRSRAVPVSDGTGGELSEWVGVLEDIDDRRRAEDAERTLTREMNHRAKNMLAVVQAIVRMTPQDDASAFARSVLDRLGALGRAHDLLIQRGWRGANLREVMLPELSPYEGTDLETPRIQIDGPVVLVRPTSVQPLAIITHELCVNAVKHGALSAPGGRVDVCWQVHDGALDLVWTEAGGFASTSIPARKGTGTRVIDASVRQLSGRIERNWTEDGLVCTLRLPMARLTGEADACRPAHAEAV